MRSKGEGSIYQRGDGRWVAAVSIGGKKISRYASTRAEATKLLAELTTQKQNHHLSVPSKTTLNEWIAQWLSLQEAELRPSTLRTYRQTLQHVAGLIGNVRVDKLTPILLSRAFAELQRQGVGQRRLNLAHTYLKTCLSAAVSLNVISVNPMTNVKKPKWTPKNRTYWSLEELQRFIQTGFDHDCWYDPLFIFLACTGLRISEALALSWEDLDPEHQSVVVEKALVWNGTNAYHLVRPKTKAGYRTVSLPAPAVQAIARVRQREGTAFIFRNTLGKVPCPSDFYRYLRKLCSLADVPVINIHGLRHVHAMFSIEATRDLYAVQRRLGHSNVAVTTHLYGYSRRLDTELVDKLNDLLDRKA